MNTHTIGDTKLFAIEYHFESVSLCDTVPLIYGYIRLWLHGEWLGDITEGMFLGSIGDRLARMRSDCVGRTRLLFSTAANVPSFEEMRDEGGWSFGEAFDQFSCVYFAVAEERSMHFVWEIHNDERVRYPDYPAGRHHVCVPFESYDAVVNRFLDALIACGKALLRDGGSPSDGVA